MAKAGYVRSYATAPAGGRPAGGRQGRPSNASRGYAGPAANDTSFPRGRSGVPSTTNSARSAAEVSKAAKSALRRFPAAALGLWALEELLWQSDNQFAPQPTGGYSNYTACRTCSNSMGNPCNAGQGGGGTTGANNAGITCGGSLCATCNNLPHQPLNVIAAQNGGDGAQQLGAGNISVLPNTMHVNTWFSRNGPLGGAPIVPLFTEAEPVPSVPLGTPGLPNRSIDAPPALPPVVPWFDPWAVPPAGPAPLPYSPPYRDIPSRQPHPNRDPRERRNVGPSAPPSRAASPGRSVAREISPTSRPVPPAGRRPPGAGVKERKLITQLAPGTTLARLISGVTEGVDTVDCLHKALPRLYKAKGHKPKPQDKLRAIYRHLNQIDVATALYECAVEQLKDMFWARVGRIGAGVNRRLNITVGVNRTSGNIGDATRDLKYRERPVKRKYKSSQPKSVYR